MRAVDGVSGSAIRPSFGKIGAQVKTAPIAELVPPAGASPTDKESTDG